MEKLDDSTGWPAREGCDFCRELDDPKNMMFMGSLTQTQDFSLQDLGGVRVIW